jgi:hypothetical protein
LEFANHLGDFLKREDLVGSRTFRMLTDFWPVVRQTTTLRTKRTILKMLFVKSKEKLFPYFTNRPATSLDGDK